MRTESAVVTATKCSSTEGEAIVANDDTNNDAQAYQRPPEPSPDLKRLGDRLVSTWEVSGDAQGRVSFEWMEGGFFLIQRVDLEQYGQRIKGIEIIGHEMPFGSEPSEEIKSPSTPTRVTLSTTSTSLRGTPSQSGEGRGVPRRMPRVNLARMTRQVRASGCIRVVAVISSP